MKNNNRVRSQIETFVVAKRAFCKSLSEVFTSLFAKICGAFKKKEPAEMKVYGVTVTNEGTGKCEDYTFSTYEERWSFCKGLFKQLDANEYNQIIRR